jgi:hypothetical protein
MLVRYRPVFPLCSPLFLLVFLSSEFASVPARAAVPACDLASTGEFLNARLAFWQQRLNLQEWKLSVLASHPSELKPETLGNIHWDTPTKTAVVRVLSISDYKMACPAALDDMELTVIHELVHLTLSPLRSSTTNRADEEHTVNQIADALLKLDRQSRARRSTPVAAISH